MTNEVQPPLFEWEEPIRFLRYVAFEDVQPPLFEWPKPPIGLLPGRLVFPCTLEWFENAAADPLPGLVESLMKEESID